MLHLAPVAHHAPLEDGGGPGNIGEPLGDQAAGAALGAAEGKPLFSEQLQADRLQTVHVGAVDPVAQDGTDLLLHRGDEGLGLGDAPGLGGDAQLHLAGLGVGGQSGVLEGVHPVPEQLLHRRLPHAENTQGAGVDHFSRKGAQQGQNLLPEHGLALPGRPREHNDPAALALEYAAGGGAPAVGEDGSPHREHGLLEVVLRHRGIVELLLEIIPDALGTLRVKDQVQAEGVGQSLAGQVVTGGAKAAGGDEDVGPAAGNVHRLPEPLGIVPHHGLVKNVDAQGGKLLGEETGVGVEDVPQQQLGAHTDQFGGMGHDRASLR